jgi:DNA-binding NtrC family response regulator
MTSRDGAGAAWLPLSGDPAPIATSESGRAPSAGGTETSAPIVNLPVDLPTLLRELEDAYIRAALARTQSNKKEAAKLLGMGRTTLVEKLRRRNLAATRTS